MLKNYIKIAWRNLSNQKLYSLINISGLAVGLAVCMTIMLYVAHEMSYDKFHKNASRIYTMNAQINMSGNVMNTSSMSYVTGPLIKQSQPTVEGYLRTYNYTKSIVVNNALLPEHKFADEKLLFADPDFFKFFSFKLLSGSVDDVLKKPFSVVISKDMAEKYFGQQNPVGKTLNIRTDSTYTYQVTGVAENNPSNSSVKFNFLASASSLLSTKNAKEYIGEPRIATGSITVYLLLKHAADAGALKRGLNLITQKSKADDGITYGLTYFANSHLTGNFADQSGVKYLKIFPLVALLILLLALVNYMSLSTARATLRAKEIGVRKVSGASRKTIALQFYVESTLFAVLSFVGGYILFYAFKPWFFNLVQLKIDNSFLYSPLVLSLLGALLLITVLVAGSYPSLVLSAFKPVVTLKGKTSKQAGGVIVRKVFTILQFTISVALIICGIIIDRQLYYFRHADTGINRENVVMIPIANTFGNNYPAFKKDVQALVGVGSTATSRYAMFSGFEMYFIEGKTKSESIGLSALSVDRDFVSTLGLQWKYKPIAYTAGQKTIIINEQAISKLSLPPNPVGQYINAGAGKYLITGVLKNFNFTSMEYAIRPLGLFVADDNNLFWGNEGCNLFIKVKPHTNLPTLLGTIKDIYKKYDQDTPFNYLFVDEAFNRQYSAEDRLASIFSIFTVITVILAAMGLFGLAAFTIEQRTKEIGIRKVLGASLASITTLLSQDFLKLVALAIIIASPLAWWAMHSWLQNFVYRITISWWVFAFAGISAIIIAILTVSYHALKSAIANPVKSLRSE
jgi:putative ABC transport system permease protein